MSSSVKITDLQVNTTVVPLLIICLSPRPAVRDVQTTTCENCGRLLRATTGGYVHEVTFPR